MYLLSHSAFAEYCKGGRASMFIYIEYICIYRGEYVYIYRVYMYLLAHRAFAEYCKGGRRAAGIQIYTLCI